MGHATQKSSLIKKIIRQNKKARIWDEYEKVGKRRLKKSNDIEFSNFIWRPEYNIMNNAEEKFRFCMAFTDNGQKSIIIMGYKSLENRQWRVKKEIIYFEKADHLQ